MNKELIAGIINRNIYFFYLLAIKMFFSVMFNQNEK